MIEKKRLSWEELGISKENYKELKKACQEQRNAEKVQMAAEQANEIIAAYIVKSVKKGKSYDDLEFDQKLGRIPCGRTDFYGYRRKFYAIFKELREEAK